MKVVLFLTVLIGFVFCGSLCSVAKVNTLVPPLDYKKYLNIDDEEAQTREVIVKIKELIKAEPENHSHYIMIAFAYDYVGEYENALKSLKLAEKYIPSDYDEKDVLYGNIALTYLRLNRLEKAKEALDIAMKSNPDNIINIRHLVDYYLRTDNSEKVVQALKKLGELAPDSEWYSEMYKYAAFDLEIENEKFIEIYRKLSEVDPDNYEAHKMYASVLRYDLKTLEENFPIIIKEFKKALELRPENIYTHISIANTYILKAMIEKKDKYYKDALSWFKKAEQIEPDNKKLIYAMGNCYFIMKEYDQAIKNLEDAYKQGLKDDVLINRLTLAYNNKAYGFYESGKNLKKGLKLINKAIELKPNNGFYLGTKAELLYKIGRYNEAHEYIQRAIALEPGYEEMEQDLANIEKALGIGNQE